MIDRASFNKVLNGKQVNLFTIRNKNGMYADITNYGAKIVSLYAPDNHGRLEDVVLGFNTLEEWEEKETYFNAVIGRYANRIKDGKFTLEGKNYELAVNNGPNHLHGGEVGFNKQVWDIVEVTPSSIKLHYLSIDGEEGYPGNLDVFVTYSITEDNGFSVHYEATTDKPTIIGLTQHAYFNLNGEGNGNIRNHELQVNANWFTQVDDSFACDGVVLSVDDHVMDFRISKVINDCIDNAFFQPGRGIDNNWVINKTQPGECALAAILSSGNRTMEVYTTQPGIQVYTGNWIEQNVGKSFKRYDVQTAVCLEAQSFPNTPNISHFPSAVLMPDDKYDEWCIYQFK